MSDLHFRQSTVPADQSGVLHSMTPRRAGWEHITFEVIRLQPGAVYQGNTGGNEAALVFLTGRAEVESSAKNFGEVGDRMSVFEGRAHLVYLPIDTAYRLKATTAVEVALCHAQATTPHEAVHVRPDQIEIEERGDGNASRTIHHLLKPEFSAERLLLVEVFTPSGNWSSYPPHKHDQHRPPQEHDLEEVYYYRIDRPEGFAIQRIYTDDRRIDEAVTVKDGDLVLVREGYHPVVAAPGCNVYYLNVLAGTGRSMAATDDPELAWVRGTWKRAQRSVK